MPHCSPSRGIVGDLIFLVFGHRSAIETWSFRAVLIDELQFERFNLRRVLRRVKSRSVQSDGLGMEDLHVGNRELCGFRYGRKL